MRLPIQVECILYRKIKDKYEFLLLKRIAKKGGFWQAITGGFEDSDINLNSACLREILEETGIKETEIINQVGNIHFFQFPNKDNKILSEYVYGFEVKPTININIHSNIYPEHDEFKWVSFDDGIKILKWDNNQVAFTKLNDYLCKK